MTAGLPFEAPIKSLPQIDRNATRRDEDGTSLTLGEGGARLHVMLLDNTRSDGPMAALVPLDSTGLDRIEALVRLWQTLNGRAPQDDTRLTLQRRRRLRHMLQAIDGHLHGATYREIANTLYGATRVANDPWKTSALRDATIALVKDGRAMVAGGYRTLLRHRRRK